MSNDVAEMLAEQASTQLAELAANYAHMSSRQRIKALVDIQKCLRQLGKRLSDDFDGPHQGARERIASYLKRHQGEPVDGEELAIVGGILDYARRIRELRESGLNIISGSDPQPSGTVRLKPDQYLLRN
jgi:hypothetical protein